MRRGKKSAAQTPAPQKERVYGSSKNPVGSAASRKSASSIILNDSIIESLKKKAEEYNEKHKNKVTVAALKAVMRRGMGAYSKSHRPTITGGTPNSRQAWGFARVNKFLKKKSGEKVKAAYVQDDDLMEKGGSIKGLTTAIPKTYQITDYNLETAKKYLTEWQKDRWIEQGRSKEQINNDIENAQREIELINQRTPFTTWFLDLPKGKYEFSVLDAQYEIKKEVRKVSVEIGWKVLTQNKNFWSVIKTNEVLSPFDFFIVNNFEYDSKENLLTDINKKFKNLIYDIDILKYPLPNRLDDLENDPDNADIRYDEGGRIKIKENTMSKEIPIGRLAKGMSVSDIAERHKVGLDTISSELQMGIKTEMEHTTEPKYAYRIALDHLYEDPRYYSKLKQFENMDNYFDVITANEKVFGYYSNGGSTPSSDDTFFKFSTPTGEPTRLNYIQQVLIRTKGFKNYFGDWQLAAAKFLIDGRNNFEEHYKGVSKILDLATLEPRVVYHGTRTEKEFFEFNTGADKQPIVGRPYGYFAYNKEYANNFTRFSQSNKPNALPFVYSAFLKIKNPFYANTQEYYAQEKNAKEWLKDVINTIIIKKYGENATSEKKKELKNVVESQIKDYFDNTFISTYGSQFEAQIWLLMARDVLKTFKNFLISHDFDGIMFAENIGEPFDIDNPAEFSDAAVVFSPDQIKLADGRNLDFDPMNLDIRYNEGGETEYIENQKDMNKKDQLISLMGQSYAKGGNIISHKGVSNDGKKGGYFDGKSHADGGIKAINVDTGQYIEVEGQEVIINKRSVNDPTKRLFEGQMLTNKEILSKINQSGGGVSFADGGELHGNCGCSGKKYNFGGQLLEDYNILRYMGEPDKIMRQSVQNARDFADMLTKNL